MDVIKRKLSAIKTIKLLKALQKMKYLEKHNFVK